MKVKFSKFDEEKLYYAGGGETLVVPNHYELNVVHHFREMFKDKLSDETFERALQELDRWRMLEKLK